MKWRDPLILIVVLLLLWQGLYFFAGDIALSSPLATFRRVAAMLGDPRFVPHVIETLLAFLQGFVLAVLLGLAIGIALGAHRLTGEVAEPIVVALYSIPKVTLYPIIIPALKPTEAPATDPPTAQSLRQTEPTAARNSIDDPLHKESAPAN